VAGDDSFLHPAQVEMLHFPRAVVPPVTAPDKAELAGRPFVVAVPVLAPWDDGVVVDVPPVRYVKADRTEARSGASLGLLGDDFTRGQVQHGSLCVLPRDERQLAFTLSERLEGRKH